MANDGKCKLDVCALQFTTASYSFGRWLPEQVHDFAISKEAFSIDDARSIPLIR